MAKVSYKKTGRYIVGVFMVFCLLSAFPAKTMATNLTTEQFQSILNASLKALWTGQNFSPGLRQLQKPFREMLETGAVTAAELKAMMKMEMLPIINQYRTDRYILEEMPERVNELLSPALDWKTVKEEIVWGVITPMLKAEPYVLTMATIGPEGTPWLDVPQNTLVPRIVQLTNGALQVKIYASGVMGEDSEILQKMNDGKLDGCGCQMLGTFLASPEASILMLPNLFNNYDEIDYIFEKFRKRLDKSFEKRGYILGTIIESGFLYMFSKYKISGLDDLRNLKMLTCLGDIESTLLKELGLAPFPAKLSEVVPAISSGRVDTCTAPASWMLGMQAYQYVNYYFKTPFFYSPAAVILSANTRIKVQEHFGVTEAAAFNTQELIVLEIKLIESEWKESGRIYEQKSLKAFESKCGIKSVAFSPEDQKAFEAAARRVREKLAGKDYPRDLLNDVLKALEEYRE